MTPFRTARAALVLALAASVLVACAPDPEPTPTPTAPFATEEEAFAAAEETYRAYIAAVNLRRESPTSDPAPDTFLIGEALEVEIDAARQFAEEGIAVTGQTMVESVEAVAIIDDRSEVTLYVCIDSSNTRVVDDSGADVTPTDRLERFGLTADLVIVDGQFSITRREVDDGASCS